MDWINRFIKDFGIYEQLDDLENIKFWGSLTLNFQDGKISQIEYKRSMKPLESLRKSGADYKQQMTFT